MAVRFLLDGKMHEIADPDPTGTVLEHLRGPLQRSGTKEGCAEGDCGACPVLVGELAGGSMAWRAVNACIQLLPMLHGKALMTVESLSSGGALNPLQACMAANGSSQCGFCTPGFVMSLHGRAIGALGIELPVADGIAGNLCRCTGYGPILEAGETVTRLAQDDSAAVADLRGLAGDKMASGTFEIRQWFVPRSSDELVSVLAVQPGARIVAGATDVGLWVTKGLRDLDCLVFIGDVVDLKAIEESALGLRIGAGVRYAEVHGALARLHPDMGELVRRNGGLHVRSSATVCGNVANGSPIGDGPPALIALGAELTLRSAAGRRTMPLEAYFQGYGKQDRRAGEFVESVFVPRLVASMKVHIFKLSLRFDSNISEVIGAFALTVEQGMVMVARLGKIGYAPLESAITAEAARAASSRIEADQRMAQGDAAAALETAPHRVSGTLHIGAQDHFHLEGQVAHARPGEDGQIHVVCSSQHPSEVQHLVAHLLGKPSADMTVEVRRMGGAFGGKESQAALFAAAAALEAHHTGRPAKFRCDREDDMTTTGKRHDFVVDYDAGHDDAGLLLAVKQRFGGRCGATMDLSPGINDRTMFHADNCYFLPDLEILSQRLKANTVSATAFRGFGGLQGMLAIERVCDAVAARLGLDPLTVRERNLYGPGRDVTLFGMRLENNITPQIIVRPRKTSEYDARREAIATFNAGSPVLKKGIALTTVKFGISFTTTHLNQAGTLVHVYADGSIQVNHGGTKMGQGLYIKVAQIVADVFGVGLGQVRITATRTDKVPNTSATAASSGVDLNGMAAHRAATAIRERMADFLAGACGCAAGEVLFTGEGVVAGDMRLSFAEAARKAWLGLISLSSTGFYATPEIEYDRAAHKGRPFYYFAYGAAVSEVVVDTLTGEHKVLAVDILHDVGRSLNPAIDRGQIEGGFVQGQGWLTTEVVDWDAKGCLLNHSPATYKVPTATDRPKRLRIDLWDGENSKPTIHRSKAVGEPLLMLANSVFCAISAAIAATMPDARVLPPLNALATPEAVLRTIAAMRASSGLGA